MATQDNQKTTAAERREARKEERAQKKSLKQDSPQPQIRKEHVVIIGGGIAGMEAAKQLLALGYKPVLVEKDDHLGGHVASWNRLFPAMGDAQKIVSTLREEIMEANIYLSTEVSSCNRLKDGYSVLL